MKKYVVIDTNVLVSALITRNENSPTVKILRFLANGNIVPVYSEEIIKEYNDVLRREKFSLPESLIINLLKDICTVLMPENNMPTNRTHLTVKCARKLKGYLNLRYPIKFVNY